MEIFVSGASDPSEKDRLMMAMSLVSNGDYMELGRDWLKDVEKEGTANVGLTPEKRRHYSMMATKSCRADVFWLLVPQFEAVSRGAWVELGMALEHQAFMGAPYIVVSGLDYTDTIFTSLADYCSVSDQDAYEHIRALCQDHTK